MNLPTALPLHSISRGDAAAVGNKAARLGELLQNGLPVPPGFVISTADCREIWREGSLSAQGRTALATAVEEFIGADCTLVVRSSGTDEDGDDYSQTGALPTEYFVTQDTLAVSILSCLSKAAAAQATLPATEQSGELPQTDDPECALIVQLLVPAIASGVLFTSGPEAHNKPTLLIEAVWGLGRALVDGKTDPDRFSLDSNHDVIDRSLGRKQHEITPHVPSHMLLSSDGYQDKLSPVSEFRQLAWTLNVNQIKSLARLATRCEEILAGPQDIEWALTSTGLCVLQSRPVSNAQQVADVPPPGEWLIFMPLLENFAEPLTCLLYTSPSPRDKRQSRMPSSA